MGKVSYRAEQGISGEKLKAENKSSSSEFLNNRGEQWESMPGEQRNCRRISARIEK